MKSSPTPESCKFLLLAYIRSIRLYFCALPYHCSNTSLVSYILFPRALYLRNDCTLFHYYTSLFREYTLSTSHRMFLLMLVHNTLSLFTSYLQNFGYPWLPKSSRRAFAVLWLYTVCSYCTINEKILFLSLSVNDSMLWRRSLACVSGPWTCYAFHDWLRTL